MDYSTITSLPSFCTGMMAAGLSNRDIGAELYLSVNTIRWYASQIYSKMGVSGRGTAVAQARELGII